MVGLVCKPWVRWEQVFMAAGRERLVTVGEFTARSSGTGDPVEELAGRGEQDAGQTVDRSQLARRMGKGGEPGHGVGLTAGAGAGAPRRAQQRRLPAGADDGELDTVTMVWLQGAQGALDVLDAGQGGASDQHVRGDGVSGPTSGGLGELAQAPPDVMDGHRGCRSQQYGDGEGVLGMGGQAKQAQRPSI